MKSTLKLFAWISGATSLILMLLGFIAVFAGGILFNHMWSNYYYPAQNFLLLGIFLFLAAQVAKDK
jgi:hypothetical protein